MGHRNMYNTDRWAEERMQHFTFHLKLVINPRQCFHFQNNFENSYTLVFGVHSIMGLAGGRCPQYSVIYAG